MSAAPYPTTTTTCTGSHHPFDSLDEDALGNILTFTDYPSTIQFVELLYNKDNNNNNKDNNRAAEEPPVFLERVWKEIFQRHCFSPQDVGSKKPCFREEIAYRRALSERLLPLRKKGRHCFSLPTSRFSFLPITPNPVVNATENEDFTSINHTTYNHHQHFVFVDNDDPPPVNFECDCFLLTSTGTSPEYVFLDPFSGTLSLYRSILDNAMRAGAEHDYHDDPFCNLSPLHPNSCSSSSSSNKQEQTPVVKKEGGEEEDATTTPVTTTGGGPPVLPKQVFLSLDHYRNLFHSLRDEYGLGGGSLQDLEVEVSNLGVEVQVVFFSEQGTSTAGADAQKTTTTTNTTNAEITMVSVGRRITNVENEQDSVVEVLTWMRTTNNNNNNITSRSRSSSSSSSSSHQDEPFRNRRICRFRRNFWTMELGASTSLSQNEEVVPKLYVNYEANNDDNDVVRPPPPELDVNDDFASAEVVEAGSSQIAVYPFVPYPTTVSSAQEDEEAEPFNSSSVIDTTAAAAVADADATDTSFQRFFPNPELVLDCREPVTSMATTVTRDQLLVATSVGNLQIWNLNSSSNNVQQPPRLVETISVPEQVKAAFARRQPGLLPSAVRHQVPPIDLFRMPQHLPIESSGFVTLHYSRTHGNTLLLWRHNNNDVDSTNKKESQDLDNNNNDDGDQQQDKSSFQVQSMINLPLAARRYCKLHYDGRRIIVFGQDHIGTLLLVYQVYTSGEDADAFPAPAGPNCPSNNASDHGGVFHLNDRHQDVRLANVIRHAALGGLDRIDSIHMTCNERFIVVNTKTGNSLNNESHVPYSEGLLVIDLDEEENKYR